MVVFTLEKLHGIYFRLYTCIQYELVYTIEVRVTVWGLGLGFGG